MSQNMSESQDEYRLNIWLPAGIGLFGIGILTLLTPLFTTLSPSELLVDFISGGVLALAGLTGLVKGWKDHSDHKLKL